MIYVQIITLCLKKSSHLLTGCNLLRELLKQKVSALYAISAVRVCQLLCTAPLETFKMQVHTNNPGQRRPMNTHLLWCLTDSPVGLRLVLWTQD